MDSDSDIEEVFNTTKKAKLDSNSLKKTNRRVQKYRKSWETVPEFQNWLRPELNDSSKCKCRICNVTFVSVLGVIKKHSLSSNHVQKLTGVSSKSQATLEAFIKPPELSSIDKLAHVAEIKLAVFFAEHNIPFNAADHLLDVIKWAFTDSKIAQAVKLKRTKCTGIVKNVIGQSHKDELANKLRDTKFSVLTDESTDIGAIKTSCVVVRFYDPASEKIVSKFWDLCNVFVDGDHQKANEGATSENLFSSLIKTLTDYNIPEENVIGFASDGCNAMMGSRNSVATRFKDKFPGVTVLKCVCHSLHLCASEACKRLPRRCEDLARNISNFFGSSAKRQAQLRQFQEFFELKVHKILHPSQTRWLSFLAVVTRIVEQWDALRLYFDKWLEERLVAVEEIHKSLNDPYMKLFFIFLSWVLPKFTEINKYFQSSKVVITYLHDKMVSAYKDMLLCYMERAYILQTEVMKIDPNNTAKFLRDGQLYLGVEVLKQIQKPEIFANQLCIQDFYSKCRDFMKTGCSEISRRYDFANTMLPLLSLLTPKKAISNKVRETAPSLIPLVMSLPRIVRIEDTQLLQQIDDDWRKLPISLITEEMKKYQEAGSFWAQLLNLKNNTGDIMFPGLPNFALAALSLPHSNADCERVFSKVNLVKVKVRNRLITPTINGCLLTSQCIKHNGASCQHFEPTDDMLRRMTTRQIYGVHTSNIQSDDEEENCILFDTD